MYFFYAKRALALFTLVFLSSFLPAQPYQKLYAYDPGTGLETGVFRDVDNLSFIGPGGIHTVAIGTSNSFTTDGLVSFHDLAGTAIIFQEWRHPGANPLEAKQIAELPSGDIISCFFDPTANSSHVIRTTVTGVVMWVTQLPDFHVRGLDCDVAPYPGGEGIWLTGNSIGNNNIALEGLDAFGAPVFAVEHFIADPLWNYSSSMGFEVDFDPVFNNLIVVGTAQIAGLPPTAMVVFRSGLGGGWIWGRSYSDPAAIDYYHGKALVASPGGGGNYTISFEYSAVGTPFDQVGIMEIDPVGNPIWIYSYPGVGFFAGTNYTTHGIDTDGGIYLTSGYFDPFATPGIPSAYTLAVDIVGNPIQYNEYAQAGYYPPDRNAFWDMDFDPMTGQHTVGGVFTTPPTAGGWPQGPNPRSFWLVNCDPIGNSICNTWDVPGQVALGPMVPNLGNNAIPLPNPIFSPLVSMLVDQREANQCFFPKRANEDLEEMDGGMNAYFEAAANHIVVETLGDLKGEGHYELVDLQGQVVARLDAQQGKQYFDAAQLSRGVYLLRYELPGIASGVQKIAVH